MVATHSGRILDGYVNIIRPEEAAGSLVGLSGNGPVNPTGIIGVMPVSSSQIFLSTSEFLPGKSSGG